MFCSGAGKSTLMAALGYRQTGLNRQIKLSNILIIYFNTGEMHVEGEILINGRPIGSYMKHLSGYMPQEDIFVASLTVFEHMTIMVVWSIKPSND